MFEKKYQKVKIRTEYITLGQFLKYQGIISSGFEAKIFINENKIFVNGVLTNARGKKLYPQTKININNTMFFEID